MDLRNTKVPPPPKTGYSKILYKTHSVVTDIVGPYWKTLKSYIPSIGSVDQGDVYYITDEQGGYVAFQFKKSE